MVRKIPYDFPGKFRIGRPFQCHVGLSCQVALGTSLPDTFASKAAAQQARSKTCLAGDSTAVTFFYPQRLEVTKNHHPKKVTKNCQFGHFVWKQGFFLVEELEKTCSFKG